MKTAPFLAFAACVASLFLAGCETDIGSGSRAADRAAMLAAIQNEPPGNYYIGRRYYKVDYKFWGYVRKPREPWTSAKLVMLNEQKRLAPDREVGPLGYDNGYEYKLYGDFSGDKVYEPASNDIYPEFVLTSYKLQSTQPGPIFTSMAAALDPARRMLVTPF